MCDFFWKAFNSDGVIVNENTATGAKIEVLNNDGTVLKTFNLEPETGQTNTLIRIYRLNPTSPIWRLNHSMSNNTSSTSPGSFTFVDGAEGSGDVNIRYTNINKGRCSPYDTDPSDSAASLNIYDPGTLPIEIVYGTISDVKSLSRTNSTIMKIIEYPYCPCQATYSIASSKYTFPKNYDQYWNYDFKSKQERFKTSGEQTDGIETRGSLSRVISSAIPVQPMQRVLPAATSTARTQYTRDYASSTYGTLESKLYHSDLFTYQFKYDVYEKNFAMERLNVTSSPSAGTMTMYATSNATSKLAFVFNWANLGTYTMVDPKENILYSNRNNELPLYTNAYLNYMNTSYSFDKKAQDTSNTFRWVNTGINILGSAGNIAAGVVKGNPMSVARGISSATSALGSIASNIEATMQAENSMAKNQAQLAAQPTSISGSDDLDIFDILDTNKVYRNFYAPTAQMTSNIYDLFFYCGYSHPVQKIPNFTGRYRFNYVQCNPSWNDDVACQQQYLDDIDSRYKVGVTHYHFNELDTLGAKWDWGQDYENWESWILSILLPNPVVTGNMDDLNITNATAFQPASTNNYRYEVQYQSNANQTYEIYPGNNQYTIQSYYQPATDWAHCTDHNAYLDVTVRARLVDISTGLTSD